MQLLLSLRPVFFVCMLPIQLKEGDSVRKSHFALVGVKSKIRQPWRKPRKLDKVATALSDRIGPSVVSLLLIFGTAITTLAMGGTAAASGSYDNATIADDALMHVGQTYGECWPFVRDMIYQASSGTQDISAQSGDYFQHLTAAGGTQITSVDSLAKGDVVQEGENGGHTYIIVGQVSGSTFDVVDSNHAYDNVVMHYHRAVTLDADDRAYRFGTAGTNNQLLWKLRNSNSGGSADVSFYYGASTDTPVAGDWDGNGTATAGIARSDGTGQLLWKLRNSNSSGDAASSFYYGAGTAIPTLGNWDGIGTTTVGVVRRDDGSGQLLWQLRNGDGGGVATYTFHYGPSNATPVVGDWDGNGTITIGVVRQDSSTGTLLWQLRNSNSSGSADITFHYGPNNATPVVGDWDGNGITTIGVVKSYDNQLYWQLRNSNNSGSADLEFYYGASTDTPIVGDWDGNKTTTIGIVRS